MYANNKMKIKNKTVQYTVHSKINRVKNNKTYLCTYIIHLNNNNNKRKHTAKNPILTIFFF